jgi:hypothetical protein
MKKTFLSILFCFIALTISVAAQNNIRNSRLSDAADRLATQTGDLSSRLYNDFRNRASNTRSDLDQLFLAQQLDSSARLFQQMVSERRRASELRDAAAILSDLSRRAPGFGSSSYLWRDVQTTVSTIQREAGTGGGYGGNNGGYDGYDPTPSRPVSGRVTWRGTVDDEIQLIIRGRNLETRAISGTEYKNETFNFTSGLPTRNLTVNVDKRKGRGTVRVIQQPTRNNDYTAVIQILDKDSGAKEYELDIYWQ